MSKKIKLIILAGSLVIALLYDWLFPEPYTGINFFLFILALLIAAFVLRSLHDKKLINWWSLVFIIPTLWFAGCAALYSNQTIQDISRISAVAILILFYFWSGVEGFSFVKVKSLLPLSLINFCARFFTKILEPLTGIFKFDVKKTGKVLGALVILGPLVLIFVGLFASADLVFRSWLKDLFSFDADGETAWRVFRTIVLLIFFGGVFVAYLLPKRLAEEKPAKLVTENKKHDHLTAKIVLVVLNLLFLTFIAIQLMFLFGGHEIIQKYDVTYADYVHQGFYQMNAIAVLVLLISYVVYRFDKATKLDSLKIFNVAFIAQTLIICASALKRLYLYRDAYGLTEARFMVWSFIIFVGLILLLLAILIIWRKNYLLFMKGSLGIGVLILMYITGINMEAHIAKVNIDRYLFGENNKLDYYYLTTLTTDATNQMARLSKIEDENIKAATLQWREKQIRQIVYLTAENNSEYFEKSIVVERSIQDGYFQIVSMGATQKNVLPLTQVKRGKYWKVMTVFDYKFWQQETR